MRRERLIRSLHLVDGVMIALALGFVAMSFLAAAYARPVLLQAAAASAAVSLAIDVIRGCLARSANHSVHPRTPLVILGPGGRFRRAYR